jgi:hypothetical protein
VKTTDEKKERNEASQLLQKCIDDINSEIKVLTRNSLLPNIKTNYLTYGYDNNIRHLLYVIIMPFNLCL